LNKKEKYLNKYGRQKKEEEEEEMKTSSRHPKRLVRDRKSGHLDRKAL
jgi:hypothetical protein